MASQNQGFLNPPRWPSLYIPPAPDRDHIVSGRPPLGIEVCTYLPETSEPTPEKSLDFESGMLAVM